MSWARLQDKNQLTKISSFPTPQQQTYSERDNAHTSIHNSLKKYLEINLTKEMKNL